MYKKIKQKIKKKYLIIKCKNLLKNNNYEKKLKKWYKIKTNGEILDLKNPKNFNQVIQKLKLYDNNASKTAVVDKYLMRDKVKKEYGNKYLPLLIGVWNKFNEINYADLPNSFVLKCNHGSGWNEIVKDKSKWNMIEAKKKFNYWLKLNYAYLNGFEMQYKNIKPKIICEEYLGDNIIDCQVYCSKGDILFISYIESPHGVNEKKSFDENWNELDFITSEPRLEGNIKKPKNLNEIIKISKDISKDYKFIRVDFYILEDGTIKISEFTFTPASGLLRWNPPNINAEMKDKIKL